MGVNAVYWIMGTLATASYVSAEQGREDAKKASGRAADQQRKSAAENAAGQAAQAASERRKQVREERIRRARIIQSSENTGTSGSSGEMGALGGMGTELGAGLGANAGSLGRAVRIGEYNQSAADFSFSAQQSMRDAESFQQLGSLALSQMGTYKSPKPGATPTPQADSGLPAHTASGRSAFNQVQ